MKLYYFPLSTYSQKVLMAFHEKGVAFEPVLTDLRDDARRAAYRELYPLGKVPLLVLDDGHMIPESSIIVEYLDTHFDSGTRLIPADADAARQCRFGDRMCDLYLDESVAALLFEGWKPEAERNADLMERSRFRIGVMYRFLDEQLAKHEWVMGSEFGMADLAAIPPLFYARQVFPYDDHPRIVEFMERATARRSWQKVQAEMQPYLEWMQQQHARA